MPLDEDRIVQAPVFRLVGMEGEGQPDRLVEPAAQGPEQVPQRNPDIDVALGVSEELLGVLVGDGERDARDTLDDGPGDGGRHR